MLAETLVHQFHTLIQAGDALYGARCGQQLAAGLDGAELSVRAIGERQGVQPVTWIRSSPRRPRKQLAQPQVALPFLVVHCSVPPSKILAALAVAVWVHPPRLPGKPTRLSSPR